MSLLAETSASSATLTPNLSTLLSLAANGRELRIVDTGAEVEAAGMVLFDAIWTVELLVVEY